MREPGAAAGNGIDVVCAMFAPALGGMEHSFVDYCDALQAQGNRVSAVIRRGAAVQPALARLPIRVHGLARVGEWHPAALWSCRRILKRSGARLAFTHGRRATNLMRRARVGLAVAQVAKAPNYTLDYLIGLDHVIATTGDLRRALIAAGQPAERVTVVPNFLRAPQDVAVDRPVRRPPVIGTLGRFVEKKGFAVFIDALAALRARGVPFRAEIGGAGPLEEALRRRAQAAGLEDALRFVGWVADRGAFFKGLDVFCVPSLDEPFGIVVIEGLAHGTATVVTDTAGPSEIVQNGETALVVPKGDAPALAAALARLVGDEDLRRRLAGAGLAHARAHYDIDVVGRRASELMRALASQRLAAYMPP